MSEPVILMQDVRKIYSMGEEELAILRNKTIGFVFQQYHLLPTMTVLENVMVPLRYQEIERAGGSGFVRRNQFDWHENRNRHA